jgi:hypothetical protein
MSKLSSYPEFVACFPLQFGGVKEAGFEGASVIHTLAPSNPGIYHGVFQ